MADRIRDFRVQSSQNGMSKKVFREGLDGQTVLRLHIQGHCMPVGQFSEGRGQQFSGYKPYGPLLLYR